MNKVGKNSEKAARKWQVKFDAERDRMQKNKAGWAKALKLLNAIQEAFGNADIESHEDLPAKVQELRDSVKFAALKRIEAEEKLQNLTEGYLRSMGPSPDGKAFTIEFENSLAPIIAQHLLGILDGKNATNYVEVVCMPKDGRRVAINVQRCAGKTPHDLRLEAEGKLAKAVGTLKQLKEHYRSLNSNDLKAIEVTLAEIESKPVEPIKLAFPETKEEKAKLRAEGWKPASECWPKS